MPLKLPVVRDESRHRLRHVVEHLRPLVEVPFTLRCQAIHSSRRAVLIGIPFRQRFTGLKIIDFERSLLLATAAAERLVSIDLPMV